MKIVLIVVSVISLFLLSCNSLNIEKIKDITKSEEELSDTIILSVDTIYNIKRDTLMF